MSIRFENVFHTYGRKTQFKVEALKDISLEIPDHSFVAIVGETGSGKSTLIQHLNALLLPDAGQINIDNFVVGSKKRKNKNIHQLRKHVGVVFQFPEYQLFEETVEKDVMFGPKNFKVKDEEARKLARDAIISVGLDESYLKRSPFELSGGEKRRVAIASILAIQPDILVLDEPTAGLDPKGAKDIMNLVESLYNSGKTIILVTHDMNLVLKYCTDVFVLKSAKLIAHGNPHDVFTNLDEDSSIDIPYLYEIGRRIKQQGVDIDLKNIKNNDDLVDFILKRKGIL